MTLYYKAESKVLKLTNLDKVLFPASGFRKRDVLKYYQQIAPFALPHLQGRPFTLRRFPSGVRSQAFFEKSCPAHRPPWIHTTKMDAVNYCTVDDLPSLLWVANLAALELHTTLGSLPNLQSPDFVVFDLDPGEAMGIRECCEVALEIRSILLNLGLEAFPKTSGQKGLHLYVPVNRPTTFTRTKTFSRAVAQEMERRHPKSVTSIMRKNIRGGRIFIDWSQNSDFKTTTTVYSLRATEPPSISMPLTWLEVERARKSEKFSENLRFEPAQALTRVKKLGDLFAPVLSLKQNLPPQNLPDLFSSVSATA